jgi:hypothetical protein
MPMVRLGGLVVGVILLVVSSTVPASAWHAPPHCDHIKATVEGTLNPLPDPRSAPSRTGQGTLLGDLDDGAWKWRATGSGSWATGSGSCTEIVVDMVVVYPPRPGDWATARVVAIADNAVENFCTPGTRRLHGSGPVTGGGGNYTGSEGALDFTGVVIGDGPTSTETIRMQATGRLKCYHVGSVHDRAEAGPFLKGGSPTDSEPVSR